MKQKTMNPLSVASSEYVAGVDIGGTKIWIHLSDAAGNIVYKRKVPTSGKPEEIYALVMETADQASIERGRIKAIGFGVPGIADSDNGIVIEAPALQWSNLPFGEQMERYFGKPIFVENDVNCAALGERWLGAARNVKDFVFIAIGTGVGSAIVANGSLVSGSQYMAGEIAYMVLDDDTLRKNSNAFGRFGLFENRISGAALSQHGYASDELFLKFAGGDAAAGEVIHRFVKDLAMGISNVVSLLNPQKVIIGGGVSRSLSPLLDDIRGTVARLTPVPAAIELSSLGEHAGAVGATAIALEKSGLLKGNVAG